MEMMMRRILILLAAFGVAATVVPAQEYSETFVASKGVDSSACGPYYRPCRTF